VCDYAIFIRWYSQWKACRQPVVYSHCHTPPLRHLYRHRVAYRSLRCGDLHYGFARVRCPDAATRCSSPSPASERCLRPSCRQKRSLMTAETIAQTICVPVPHRQLVFTIPKRLRVYWTTAAVFPGRPAGNCEADRSEIPAVTALLGPELRKRSETFINKTRGMPKHRSSFNESANGC
jgi:hypothetical protein